MPLILKCGDCKKSFYHYKMTKKGIKKIFCEECLIHRNLDNINRCNNKKRLLEKNK